MLLSFLSDPRSTVRSNCTTGSVQLANALEVGDTVQGRVEVCINQAWGTVCSNRFNHEDAGTVCVAAGGFMRNGEYVWMWMWKWCEQGWV
jgi:hypothetical protein